MSILIPSTSVGGIGPVRVLYPTQFGGVAS